MIQLPAMSMCTGFWPAAWYGGIMGRSTRYGLFEAPHRKLPPVGCTWIIHISCKLVKKIMDTHSPRVLVQKIRGCKVEQVERPRFVICRYRMVSQPKMLNNFGSNQKSSTIPNFTIFIGGMVTIPKWMIYCFTHMAMNQYLLIPFLEGYSHP